MTGIELIKDDYPSWVSKQSRRGKVGIGVLTPVLLLAFGSQVETLQATIGVLLTQVVTWVLFAFALYTIVLLGYTAVKGGEQ